jgi:hypothetical protein
MAKQHKRSRKPEIMAAAPPPAPARVSASVAADEAGVPVIDVPPGGTLEVVVDVGEMVIPYTVAYGGTTVIKSLVDRAEPVALRSGSVMLAWAFAHVVKDWSHSIGYSVNGGPVVVLEQRSEKAKDTDHSVGFALVRA